MDYKAFNESVVDEFRTNAGKLAGDLADMPVVLVTRQAPNLGEGSAKPLLHTRDGDDVVIIASNGGAPATRPGTTASSRIQP